ncbi:MAG: carboxyltransferase domain-containing protein [Cytophagaceae bacterium]|nr:carboxyltransferase domain-containing protein [Cytophagaceae bacterium]
MSSTLQISYINEKALNICFGEGICTEINQKVLSFFSFLKIKNHPEIIDLVPTYNTLGIYFSENFIGNFESTILHLHSEFIENGLTEKIMKKNYLRFLFLILELIWKMWPNFAIWMFLMS